MKIVIGCDEAAYAFKEAMKKHLEGMGITCLDVGVHNTDPVLYPDIAAAACERIQNGEAERGILICGTGIGMSITANKCKGIRAAVCHDVYSAERARKSNDAQVMCLGARIVGMELAKMLVNVWLSSEFSGGSSVQKVERIAYYENVADRP